MRQYVLIFAILTSSPAFSADLGVDGTIWPITEPDLIESIHHELGRAESDGRLALFNDNVSGQAKSSLLDQRPSLLPRAREARQWHIDPSITVNRDIRTHQGVLIAARGTRINPLERVFLHQDLIFIDGQDDEQVMWALGQPGKLILTGGKPKALMDRHERRFYFDQKGILS